MTADKRGIKGRKSLNGRRSKRGAKNISPLLSVRIAPELMARLEAEGERSGQSKPALVRRLLADALAARERAAKPEPAKTSATEAPAPTPQKKRKKKAAASRQLAFDLPSDPDWRAELFAAHQGAVDAGQAEGRMVALDVLARRLGWSVEEVRRRIERAHGERWGVISRPISGVDDLERANLTTPPTGAALQHAGAAADLRRWRQQHADASSRLAIRDDRLDALVELRFVPARWERQQLLLQAGIPNDAWPKASPKDWTRERATTALRAALPEDPQISAEVARRCDVQFATLKRWASGKSKPGKPSRDAVEREFGVPTEAWET